MSVVRTLAAVTLIGSLFVMLGCGNKSASGEEPAAPAPPSAATASPPPELLDVRWELRSFGWVGEEDEVLPETIVTLTLRADTTLSGSTGCNDISTTYASDGTSTLTLRGMARTERVCPDPIMFQETEIARALGSVENFDVGQDELLLFYDGGDGVLVFERSAEDETSD